MCRPREKNAMIRRFFALSAAAIMILAALAEGRAEDAYRAYMEGVV
jgi:hypothetical protein